MKYISIVNYGAGNLRSLQKAFDHLGFNSIITEDKEKIKKSSALVMPGVGAFGYAMKYLKDLKLIPTIKDFILSGKPFLGICLGLQMLFKKSEEDKKVYGLDIIKGEVLRFKMKNYKIPHMGWNTVIGVKNNDLLNIRNNSFFYFVHSYYCNVYDKDCTFGYTDYGTKFISVLHKNNIYGTQFHPEKSGENGLSILKVFGGLSVNHTSS